MVSKQQLEAIYRRISEVEVHVEELKLLVQSLAESDSAEEVARLQKENQTLRERLREQDIMNYIESKSHEKR